MSESIPNVCPSCKNLVLPGSNFCQTCGFQLANISKEIGIGRQIYIYAISLFLPPLGLIWTFKYFRSDSAQLKRIAVIATVLTVISALITIWWTLGFISSLQQQFNSYSNLGM